MPSSEFTNCPTLPELIRRRAERTGDRTALVFVSDDDERFEWTYGDLWRRALETAARLPEPNSGALSDASASSDSANRISSQGQPDRALLLFPPGLEFMAGFLGAQLAGFIPVPTAYPKPNRQMPRLDSAADDCRPTVLIGDAASLAGLDDNRLAPSARSIARVATDENVASNHGIASADAPAFNPQHLPGADTVAFLQYTSGSTSEPKGVLVRHRNLIANLESIRRGFQIDWQDDDVQRPDRGVFWLPFFHDMGLIGGILEPLYVGGTAVLMSPRAFLRRPIRWLELISEEKARISGAPNFAFQLAVDRVTPEQADNLDLSNWKTAFCGAEPIAPRTLSDFANRFEPCGFSRDAFYPCYGLAEATLLAAGGDGPSEPKTVTVHRGSLGQGKAVVDPKGRGREFVKLVACGSAAYQTELVIVDPESRQPVESQVVGEIWIRGEGVTDGYWNRDEENETQFRASLAQDDGRRFCRTGDLGFEFEGNLFITGRRKDVVVLRGRNHYPQDIEATVRELFAGESIQTAAFAVDAHRGEALIVVVELPRRDANVDHAGTVRRIRRAIVEAHEIDPTEVLLVRAATVPLTSSGKVQRLRCRQQFLDGDIKTKHHYRRAFAGEQSVMLPDLPASPDGSDRNTVIQAIEAWLVEWLTVRAGVRPDDIELDKPFAEYGLDSMTAVEMSGEIEDWSGIELTPVLALNHPTVSRLSVYLADQWLGDSRTSASAEDGSAPQALNGHADDLSQPTVEELDPAELEGLLDEIEGLSEDQVNHALADKRRT
ncbi:AMP-binding protein [Crateriforma conspicua]|uniref:Long-chain-fatty-acid--AMP ligase FadD29 n=1 Tax=Crateriforma conspicua TaxID=2527996 RepID=A0A5C5XS82_9PLAN|nr:AMP-binding protein [Crateriforma conspicua]QDV60921.1 Long-chain-fatty-acid--AMP ligase FadD29 [Crateriforma conspicua]TWT65764.1 Long-chain-fatty-acid--AMP ligase FadD29 [Crateriforma conspicua]